MRTDQYMNKQSVVITQSSVIIIGLIVIATSFSSIQNTSAIKQGSCPNMDFLWKHTYGASTNGQNHASPHQTHSRLLEHKPACVVFEGHVSGTPKDPEGDGDLHINVLPDGNKGNDNYQLLNKNNTKGLVVELICWDKPNYKKYSNFNGYFCDGVDSRAHIPVAATLNDGDHIRVTGKWVKDVGYPRPDHVEWNEIHPVESIEKLK